MTPARCPAMLGVRAGAMNEDDIRKRLAASAAFGGLAAGWLERLAAETTVVEPAQGDVVWRTGDLATRFVLLQRGLVKILAPGLREPVVAVFGPRETIGDVAVLSGAAYPADAVVASRRATILKVRAAPILEAMPTEPALAMGLNRALIEHSRALQSKVAILSAGEVPQRLASALLHLGERFGDTLDDDTLIVPVALSRAELAGLVGARVETVIRVASRWQKEGLVMTRDDGFEVPSIAALRAILHR